jgi:pyruvate formate lyase activating enzyme
MKVQCELCPKNCIIDNGQSGNCHIRINIDGTLRSVTYGYPCSINIDPIEKKPLFHFLPSSTALSLATAGCNLHCLFCQNWEISQASAAGVSAYKAEPEKIIELAQEKKIPSIAYTYSDPVVFYEYTLDISKLARSINVKNVLVTAAYINEEPLKQLLEYTDAANIDLKGITDEFYRQICDATLKPVLNAMVLTKAAGVHLEITNLIIPTLNDKPEQIRQLVRWIRDNLGTDTPLHFSRFFPLYKLVHLAPTSEQTLTEARQIALEEGMEYVYIGNIASKDGQNTYCPKCKKLLIERSGYTILQNRLKGGACPDCSKKIYGVWQ